MRAKLCCLDVGDIGSMFSTMCSTKWNRMVNQAIVIAAVVGLFGLGKEIRAGEVSNIVFDTDIVEGYRLEVRD